MGIRVHIHDAGGFADFAGVCEGQRLHTPSNRLSEWPYFGPSRTRARSHCETSTRAEKRVPKQGSDALGDYLNPEGQAKARTTVFLRYKPFSGAWQEFLRLTEFPEGIWLVPDFRQPPSGGAIITAKGALGKH